MAPDPLADGKSVQLGHGSDDAEDDVSCLIGVTRFRPLRYVKTIMVTGGLGFIGSWVTRHIAIMYEHDYNVICFDKIDVVSSTNNISCLLALPNFHFVKGDITSMADVLNTFETYHVDCILHFAASSHVQKSFTSPFLFTYNNVIGTQVLLEAARSYGKIKRFIHVSTDEVYGETNGVLADESRNFYPTNPYSASKAAAEMYILAYHKSFGIPIIIVRSNNVFGPCQYPEKIIPTFAKLLMKGKRLTLQGDGMNSRSYLYGADAADAFDTILHKGVIGQTYNISSNFELKNRDVAERMLAIFGHDKANGFNFDDCVEYIRDRPFNDHDYRVDGTKLKKLGWKQRTDFDTGLRKTARWYIRHLTSWWRNKPKIDSSMSVSR